MNVFEALDTGDSAQMIERGRHRRAAMPEGPHSQRITVAGNTIAHCGRFTPEAVGVFVGDNANSKVIRNHVYYKEGKAVGDYGSAHYGRDVCAFDDNLYWNVSDKPVLFGMKSLAEWQAVGQEKNSLITDPLFVDAAQDDFRMRPGSPATRTGFQSWDFSVVGPRPGSVNEGPQ